MKYILAFTLMISSSAFADIASCMKSAKISGQEWNGRPGKKCEEEIRKHSQRIEVKSLSGKYRITALETILYLDTFADPDSKKPTKQEMLAGDQTDLRSIKKVWINEKKNVFQVLQAGKPYGLLTFTLSYASNTTPLRHFVSPILNNATNVKLLDNRDEIAVMSKSGQSIRFINSGADNIRYKGGDFKPLLLREIKGPDAELIDPVDVVLSEVRKEVYVLDSGRILVFPLAAMKEARPYFIMRDISFHKAVAIELGSKEGTLLVRMKDGKSQTIPVKATRE